MIDEENLLHKDAQQYNPTFATDFWVETRNEIHKQLLENGFSENAANQALDLLSVNTPDAILDLAAAATSLTHNLLKISDYLPGPLGKLTVTIASNTPKLLGTIIIDSADQAPSDSIMKSIVSETAGFVAGIIVENIASGLTDAAAVAVADTVLGAPLAPAIEVVGKGLAVTAGTAAGNYFIQRTRDVWEFFAGPNYIGEFDKLDNSLSLTINQEMSEALEHFWDGVEVDVRDENDNVFLQFTDVDEWSIKQLRGENPPFIIAYEKNINRYSITNPPVGNNLQEFSDSSEENGKITSLLLLNHKDDFLLAFAGSSDHQVRNYYSEATHGLIADEALNDAYEGETQNKAIFALVNLYSFVEEGVDDYNSVNPDDYSEQYFKDRAAFLFYHMHEGSFSDTPDDMQFYDTALGESAYAGNGTPDLTDRHYIFGNIEGELIEGRGKEDHLYGMEGDDILRGEGGNDYLEGGQGLDTMYGGTGNDTFYIQGNKDEAYDNFYGGGDTDTILGSAEDDTIRVNSLSLRSNSIEIINGADGENTIAGTESNNTINLTGITVSNIDRIEGGTGHDTIIGSSGADILYGGSKDQVEDYGRDRLEGGAGNDTYYIGVNDSVYDSDGQGTIIFNGQQLPSFTLNQQGENGSYYKDENDSWRAVLGDDGSLLVIAQNSSDSFTIRNFSSGQHGITLETYEAPDVEYDYNLVGTANHDEMAIEIRGQDQQYWDLVFTSFPEGTTSNTPFYTHKLPTVAPNMTISGGASGDYLFGFQAADRIDGGAGNDVIMGHLGVWEDIELTMTGAIEGDVLDGGSGHDWIKGSSGDDLLSGGADNDIIESLGGKDVLFGDTGNDVLAGGPGDTVIFGGEGDDALFGDGYITGENSISPANVDQFGMNFIYHEDGYITDYASVGYGIQNYTSDPGNDFLSGGLGCDYLSGGAGHDILQGDDQADTLIGGDGNDLLDGGSGNDWLVGDNGDLSGSGDDILSGGSGNDLLYGLGGHDILYGDTGADTLIGEEGSDTLYGGAGNDNLTGGAGSE